MRIAQVAPLHERVPPKFYGGTERIVAYLTEQLVDLGHEVTLFASGDSQTQARLVSACEKALRLDPDSRDVVSHHVVQLQQVISRRAEFDIIHFHTDYMHFPLVRLLGLRHVSTLHGRLDLKDINRLFTEFSHLPMVSVSYAQREPLPWVNWAETVYHGLPSGLLTFQDRPGRYLAFLGRFSPEKQPDHAIEIARRCGIPLKLAAKVDKADQDYFEAIVKPQVDGKLIEYIGEIGDHEKQEFLGNALALLFPINWPEPFGLVMIEAMACGTPVIAYPCGAVQEIMHHGETGFVAKSVEEATHAVDLITPELRWTARAAFDERFTARRMAMDYVALYEQIVSEQAERAVV